MIATASESVGIFNFIPGYRDAIYDTGKEPLLIMLVSFLIAFALARGYARLARRRGWGSGSVGGVHLHHSVPGLILALIGGFLGYVPFADSRWVHLLGAIMFGVGAALVLDEFALIFRLKDVYWSEEGRSSVDATIMGAIACGALLIASAPFGVGGTKHDSFVAAFIVIALNVVWALICFVKAKPLTGTAGILLPTIALIGALRLAKPGSPWAHKFYAPVPGHERKSHRHARKLERAEARADHGFAVRFNRWFVDLVGGKPSRPPMPTAEDIGSFSLRQSSSAPERRAPLD